MANNGINMFANERFKQVLDYLKEHNRATVEELSKVLYVSPATVRRDLKEMKKLGLIQRTHGGAIANDNSDEVNIFVRIEKNMKDKEEAASLALNRLPPFNTVFIDNSSTCLVLADKINLQFKTVVTNGFQLAMKLASRKDVTVIFLGGEVRNNASATYGALATSMLDKFRFDLMLISCASVGEDGCYETSIDVADIKSAAYSRSNHHILLVDKTKFNLNSPYRVRQLNEFQEIYTNAGDDVVTPLRDSGYNIINK